MPGICGITGTSSTREHAGVLAEMMQSMKHHPWYIEQVNDDASEAAVGRVSKGFINTARQPVANEDKSLLAVMEGELYNDAELRQELTAAGHVFAGDSHAELLVHGYEQEGQRFFARLNGLFSAALWDRRKQQLILVNDRFGMKPLYYAHLPEKLLFASEMKALLVDPEVSRQVNPRGLSQFFTFGQFLGEDTMLEGVCLLPPAGWLVYDMRRDELTLQRYWQFSSDVSSSPINRATTNGALNETELLDRLDAAFKSAVDCRTHGTDHLGLSLSGGLDARTILGAMDSDCPVKTITLGMAGSIDHRSSAELARLAGRPHHPFLLNADFLANFEQHIRTMVHLTDGQYISQCIVLPTFPLYRQLGVEVLLRGHAGELMHMDKAYNFSVDDQAWQIADETGLEAWLNRHMRAHMLDDTGGELFAPAIQAELENLARDSVRCELRHSQQLQSPVHRIWHMFLSQRVRRETSLSLVKFNSFVETRLPYLDNEVVDALLAAPPQMKLGDKIQAHILRRHQPSFLKVPNSNTGTGLGAGRMRQLLAKVRLKVLSKLRVPGFQPYERLGQWLREDLRPFVENLLLTPRCLERGVFNPTTLRAVVQRHLYGRSNHTFLILALMVFELGQREFIDGEAHDQYEQLAANNGTSKQHATNIAAR